MTYKSTIIHLLAAKREFYFCYLLNKNNGIHSTQRDEVP